MPLYMVCEHIAQYHIGHTFGGKRFLCTQHDNVYFPDAPHTDYAFRGDGVIIIKLESHRQWVSPVLMVNSATLRWTLSPLRKASFDSKSLTVYPNRVLPISCAWIPSQAPSKTPTIVPTIS